MKIRRKNLKFRPGFVNIIPRFPAMVCKRDLLQKTLVLTGFAFKIVYNGIMKTVRKWPSIRQVQQQPRVLAVTNVVHFEIPPDPVVNNIDISRKYIEDSWNKEHTEAKENNGDNNENKMLFAEENICFSCNEILPAFRTCDVCIQLNSSFPSSSCIKCQKEKPLILMCLTFHSEPPELLISMHEKKKSYFKNFDLLNKLQREGPKESSEAQECTGEPSMIQVCLECACIYPALRCTCASCRRALPVVKIQDEVFCRPALLTLCPCSQCTHLFPTPVTCDECLASRRKTLDML